MTQQRVTGAGHVVTAARPLAGQHEPASYFVADQRRAAVTMMKPGQWVYLDDSAWHRVVKIGRPYEAPVPGTAAKRWHKLITVKCAGTRDRVFPVTAKLWVRDNEEGD
ncbi:MAG: hypothetical protein HOQ07_08680 [Sinomonas sp.]|nr:hypothetical protein [Sinomonas sp.]